jgi:hypothetical protein
MSHFDTTLNMNRKILKTKITITDLQKRYAIYNMIQRLDRTTQGRLYDICKMLNEPITYTNAHIYMNLEVFKPETINKIFAMLFADIFSYED